MASFVDALQVRERTFNVNGLSLAAKEWGDRRGIPTFGLHGWLDNANTFDRIAPLLPELHFVALDLAGHGRSAHRPASVHYDWTLDMQEILAIARELEWDRFSLIGHSMGAAIATELAALFPERIERVVMIDGFLYQRDDAAERMNRLRQSIVKMLASAGRQAPVYTSVEDMIQRVVAATDQSHDAAATLVARGHKAVAGGFTWRSDPRLRVPSPGRRTDEEIDELMRRSRAPSLLIVADRGEKWYHDSITRREQHHPALRVTHVDGPHHLHLEAQAPQVAELIRQHLTTRL